MKISLDFLKGLIKNKSMKVSKVPKGHYYYEYIIQCYDEGIVFGHLELEHDIISDVDGRIIGHFGIEFSHNVLVYYLNF